MDISTSPTVKIQRARIEYLMHEVRTLRREKNRLNRIVEALTNPANKGMSEKDWTDPVKGIDIYGITD